MTAFWFLAPIVVTAALGLVFSRKTVHSALCLAVVMVSLAVLYAVQGAPFLFAVQIIVYTGAVMMLFLFVVMLVGVDSARSLTETIKGQRVAAGVVGIVFGTILVVAVAQTITGTVVGIEQANAGGNVEGLAALMFGRYVLAFEVTAALFITAVLGAMVLAHRERLFAAPSQADRAAERMRRYAEHGTHPGNAPTPGVYARHNAVDTPALLPDGSTVEGSVPPSLRARGQRREGYDTDLDEVMAQVGSGDELAEDLTGTGEPRAGDEGPGETRLEDPTLDQPTGDQPSRDQPSGSGETDGGEGTSAEETNADEKGRGGESS